MNLKSTLIFTGAMLCSVPTHAETSNTQRTEVIQLSEAFADSASRITEPEGQSLQDCRISHSRRNEMEVSKLGPLKNTPLLWFGLAFSLLLISLAVVSRLDVAKKESKKWNDERTQLLSQLASLTSQNNDAARLQQEISRLEERIENLISDYEELISDNKELTASNSTLVNQKNDLERRLAMLKDRLDNCIQSDDINMAITEAEDLLGFSISINTAVTKLMGILHAHKGDTISTSVVVLRADIELLLRDLQLEIDKILLTYCNSNNPDRDENYATIAPIVNLIEECKILLERHAYRKLHERIHIARGYIDFFNITFGSYGNTEEEAGQTTENIEIPPMWLNSSGDLMNFYTLFEIPSDIEFENIDQVNLKKQYKKLSKRYHPDLTNDNGIQPVINMAYGILTDEQQFMQYRQVFNHFIKNNLTIQDVI